MKIAGHLVWVKTPRGPRCEKWPADMARRDEKDPSAPVVLKEYPLNAEQFTMKLSILEQRFPAP